MKNIKIIILLMLTGTMFGQSFKGVGGGQLLTPQELWKISGTSINPAIKSYDFALLGTDGTPLRLFISNSTTDQVAGDYNSLLTLSGNLDANLGRVVSNRNTMALRWESHYVPTTDTTTHQSELWLAFSSRTGGLRRYWEMNTNEITGNTSLKLSHGNGTFSGNTEGSYFSGNEAGTQQDFYIRGYNWLQAAQSGALSIMNIAFGANSNVNFTNRLYTDAYFLQGGTLMNIFPGGLTLGTVSGTGTKPIYLDSLYQGTTLVLDASRNLLNIGTITASGITQIGSVVNANYSLALGVTSKNGLYVEGASTSIYATKSITTETTFTAIGESYFGNGADAGDYKLQVNGNTYASGNLSVQSSLITDERMFTLADSASISIATGVCGFGRVMIGDSQEEAEIKWDAAGVVTLIRNSINVANDGTTDGKLQIYDGGSGIVIKNYLGSSLKCAISLKYYTP